MKGHIRKRGNSWAIVLEIRDPVTGVRKRKWHTFSGPDGNLPPKKAAEAECRRLLGVLDSGASVDISKETVTAFLERWIEHMRGQLSPRSHERYAEICRKNIMPLLGGLILSKLQPAHISAAYAKALASGRRDGRGGLSARTVTHMHRILRQALQQAVKWQPNTMARNPADHAKPPRVERKQMSVLDAVGTAELIDAARSYTIFIPIVLGVLCGMRRGEIAALRWRSVDLDTGQLAVVASVEQMKAGCREKETKSGRCRTIAMPALVVAELRRHRIEQVQAMLGIGVRVTSDHHVVMQADATPLQPNSLTHSFTQFIEARGLKRVRLHDLRHSHATHMLAAGVHPKIASERLGHSKVGITLDLYSHVMPGMQEEAAIQVDALISGALLQRQKVIR
jgi:integrase